MSATSGTRGALSPAPDDVAPTARPSGSPNPKEQRSDYPKD